MSAFDEDYVDISKVKSTGAAAEKLLSSNHWTPGLQSFLFRFVNKIPIRFFVCDDSGSMSSSDGVKLGEGLNGAKSSDSCSRWEELLQSVNFHMELSRQLQAPSTFLLLNAPHRVTLGVAGRIEDTENTKAFLRAKPNDRTPICARISDIVERIRRQEGQLRKTGQLACVVILTDGESTDGEIIDALKPFIELPVWVVIRLCTNEKKVVDYWNEVDKNLELKMEVLEDLFEETNEVFEHNPWLTYCEPLHRLREFGVALGEIDMLDEAPLSLEQIRLVCSIIFGGEVETYPHPEAQWNDFIRRIAEENAKCAPIWSPKFKDMRPWINMEALKLLAPR